MIELANERQIRLKFLYLGFIHRKTPPWNCNSSMAFHIDPQQISNTGSVCGLPRTLSLVSKNRIWRFTLVKYWWLEAEACHNSAPNHLKRVRGKPQAPKSPIGPVTARQCSTRHTVRNILRLSDGAANGVLRLSTRRVEARSASFTLIFMSLIPLSSFRLFAIFDVLDLENWPYYW